MNKIWTYHKMRGKNRYSDNDAKCIRKLLNQKVVAERNEQKRIRHQLRSRYEFYISDFVHSKKGFNSNDFEELVKSGRITIEKLSTENT